MVARPFDFREGLVKDIHRVLEVTRPGEESPQGGAHGTEPVNGLVVGVDQEPAVFVHAGMEFGV